MERHLSEDGVYSLLEEFFKEKFDAVDWTHDWPEGQRK